MSFVYENLGDLFQVCLYLFQALLLASVILGWVGADPSNPLVKLVRQLTEPVLQWLRRQLPFLTRSGIDLSPVAAWLITVFLLRALVGGLYRLAAGA